MIIKAGEKPPIEWREKRNALKRGVVAKAKFDAARRDFAAFLQVDSELVNVKSRAYIMYEAYLEWAEREGRLPVMSMRAFGFQARKYFVVKKGQGGVIFYVGLAPKNLELTEKTKAIA